MTPPPPPPSSVPEPAPTQDLMTVMRRTLRRSSLSVRALHAYSGSPDDPNELTFEKGEVLEIEDQEGKW
ncbi:hypothetical protein B0H13DRAFT_2346569 [Mycena leptocephala]|nr:hypothetical protein B0H13DRAFT_2346569 [Mycena leptocephala]